MRSVVLLLLSLCSCLSHGYRIQTIQQCGSHCNQGLHCKTKPDLSFPQCKKPPKGLQDNVSLNMSVSTVMKCEGRQQCSLFLQVRSTLLMNEHVKGVSICTVAAGVMERCRTHTFPKGAVKRLSTQQVEIQDNCFEVAVGQIVHVTLKTSPEFCHLSVSKMYNVPGCNHADLQKNVPECIVGEITYQLDSEKKALSVSVSNMLESTDYNLRLCHKGYFCRGTGAYALLKKEEPVKNVTLQYARPLPCLCIEGWSSVFDAPRVQVCPFKNNMEELWSGVAFDSVEQMLSWEPACQTDVVVTLCQRSGEEICENLANASKSVSKTKVLFSTVDPHPQLCMKFTTKTATWIKCPFAGGGFTAWDIGVVMENGKTQLLVTSKSRPTLLISFCRRTGPSACEENKDVITFNVEKYQSVVPNLTFNMCGQNCCIQAKRADVKYAPTILHCDFKSSPTGEAPFPVPSSSHWEAVWIVAPAVGLLTALLVALFMLGIALIIAQCATSGYSRSKSFIADSVKSSSPQKALPRIYYNYPTHQDTANFENKNLLNWAKKDSTIV